jgi:hypothetical protein
MISPASARRRGSQGSGPPPRPAEKGFVRVVELGRRARRRDVDATVRPLLVEPDHPATQRGDPSLHAKPRRARPQVPGAFDPLRAFGKPPNLTGRIVRPNRHRLARGKHPSVCHLESRHRRLGIPRGPPNRRVGIRPLALQFNTSRLSSLRRRRPRRTATPPPPHENAATLCNSGTDVVRPGAAAHGH